MILKKMILMVTFLLIPSILAAHEIQMKSGKVYNTDTYWEQDDEVIIEKYGATLYLDKNDIEKIVNDFEDKTSSENTIEIERKYNYNYPSVITLKDGRKIKAQKSWVENGQIICQTEEGLYSFSESEIVGTVKTPVEQNPVRYSNTTRGRSDLSHLKTGSLALKRFFENPPKSKCKACNGTGRVPDKNWREKFEGYDSFGNPMMIPVYEVTGTRRCPLCNGMGIYPP